MQGESGQTASTHLVFFGGDVHADESELAAPAAGGSFQAGNNFAVLKAREGHEVGGNRQRQKQNLFGGEEGEQLGLDGGTEDGALSFLRTAESRADARCGNFTMP